MSTRESKRNIDIFIGIVVFLLIFSIFHRNWFFTDGILFGHNWDYSLPDFNILRSKLAELSIYSYHAHFESSPLLVSQLPHNYLYSSIPHFFSTSIVNKFVLFICTLFSFMGMFALIRDYSGKYIAYLTALLYAFSPFFFSIVIAGSWYSWVSYAFAPLYIYFVLRYVLTERYQFMFLAGVSHIFLIGFLQYYAIIFIITMIWIFSVMGETQLKFNDVLVRLLKIYTFLLILSSYWVVPLILSFAQFSENVISNNSLIGNFEQIRNSGQDLIHIFNFSGFLNRHFYYLALDKGLSSNLYIFSAFPIYIIIVFRFFSKCKINKKLFINIFLFLTIMIFLVKGNNPPFAPGTMEIYKNFIFMKMYRSPQNLFFLITIVTSILLGLSLGSVRKSLIKRKAVVGLVSVLILSSLFAGWWLGGDMGSSVLSAKKEGHISFYPPNEDIEKMVKNNLSDQDIYNELFIPLDKSVKFLTGSGGQGNEPNIAYLKNTSPLSRYNTTELNNIFKNDIPLFLILQHNIRYISVRDDIKNHFKEFSNRDKENLKVTLRKKYKSTVHNNSVETFQIPRALFVPHLISCDNYSVIGSNSKFELLTWLNMSIDELKTNLCTIVLRKDDDYFKNSVLLQKPKSVIFEQNSPVRKSILLSGLNINDNVLIRSSIKHDESWEMALEGDLDKDLCKKYGLEDFSICSMLKDDIYFFNLQNLDQNIVKKVKMDGWPYDFNGWLISVKELLNKYPEIAIQREDGLIDIEITVWHEKQIFVIVGRYISFISIFFILLLTILGLVKNKFNHKK